MKNPALHQEPRYEPASVIPLKQESSLLDWLKASGRIIPREPVEDKLAEIYEEEELIEGEEEFIDEDEDIDLD